MPVHVVADPQFLNDGDWVDAHILGIGRPAEAKESGPKRYDRDFRRMHFLRRDAAILHAAIDPTKEELTTMSGVLQRVRYARAIKTKLLREVRDQVHVDLATKLAHLGLPSAMQDTSQFERGLHRAFERYDYRQATDFIDFASSVLASEAISAAGKRNLPTRWDWARKAIRLRNTRVQYVDSGDFAESTHDDLDRNGRDILGIGAPNRPLIPTPEHLVTVEGQRHYFRLMNYLRHQVAQEQRRLNPFATDIEQTHSSTRRAMSEIHELSQVISSIRRQLAAYLVGPTVAEAQRALHAVDVEANAKELRELNNAAARAVDHFDYRHDERGFVETVSQSILPEVANQHLSELQNDRSLAAWNRRLYREAAGMRDAAFDVIESDQFTRDEPWIREHILGIRNAGSNRNGDNASAPRFPKNQYKIDREILGIGNANRPMVPDLKHLSTLAGQRHYFRLMAFLRHQVVQAEQRLTGSGRRRALAEISELGDWAAKIHDRLSSSLVPPTVAEVRTLLEAEGVVLNDTELGEIDQEVRRAIDQYDYRYVKTEFVRSASRSIARARLQAARTTRISHRDDRLSNNDQLFLLRKMHYLRWKASKAQWDIDLVGHNIADANSAVRRAMAEITTLTREADGIEKRIYDDLYARVSARVDAHCQIHDMVLTTALRNASAIVAETVRQFDYRRRGSLDDATWRRIEKSLKSATQKESIKPPTPGEFLALHASSPISFVWNDEYRRKGAVNRILGTRVASKRKAPMIHAPNRRSINYDEADEHDVLSHSEETALFRQLNLCRFRAERARQKIVGALNAGRLWGNAALTVNASDYREFKKFLDRSRAIRDQIIEANLRLVHRYAAQFAPSVDEMDDWFEDFVGLLINAIDTFDYTHGTKLSTHVLPKFKWHAYRHRTVPSEYTNSDRTEIALDDTAMDGAVDDNDVDGTDLSEFDRNRLAMVRLLVEKLDDQEQRVVLARFRFGEGTSGGKTLRQVGKDLGLSKERVRQIEAKALQHLRDAAKAM